MKSFLIVLLACLFFQNVFSQDKDKRVPTPKQMQVQIKQARTAIEQQIIDQENQIAEAEKSGADPNEINEMRKNLAMMKKMAGVVDKVATINPNKRPETISTTNTVAPYQSPYIKFYTQPVVTPTEAQAKDKLLWYRGKKVNKNILITTKGRVIQYDRQNNRVIVQYNEKKDTNTLKIINNLKKSRQWTNNYVNNKSAEKNSFFDYPLVMMAMKEYELIEKDFDKIANNTFDLPGTGTNPIAEIIYKEYAFGSGPSADYEFNDSGSIDPYVEHLYEEVMSLMNNAPPVDCTPPPKQDYSLCYNCDLSALEHYDREKEIWGDALHELETNIIRNILSIERHYALLGTDTETELTPAMQSNLDKAGKFAWDRMEKRIKILQQRYGNDIYRYSAVVSATLGLERQKALLGVGEDEFSLVQLELFKQHTFEKFIADRIAANDYDVIFNYAMILGFVRQMALLGCIDDEHDTYSPMIESVVNHNRFALTVDLDFELDWGEGEDAIMKAFGTLSTKNKVYVKLGRNQDCKWQFYLFDADYSLLTWENVYKIPLVVSGGTKMVKKQPSGWDTYSYSGPTDVLMIFPSFRMSFCNGANKDSAMMDLLRYEQEDLSAYKPGRNYVTDFLGYANKMLVGISKTMDNRIEMGNIIDEMVDVASHKGTVDNPTGYSKLDKMQMEFKTNGIQHDLQKKTTEATKVDNTVILFDAQNGSPFLINSTTNTANTELGEVILKKGLIKLKVVLEPL